jgi:RimJ/RimL family protein N-acetyltransferase
MYQHQDGIHLRKINKSDLHPLTALKQESWWGTHRTVICNAEDQLRWYESLGQDSLFMMAESATATATAKSWTSVPKSTAKMIPIGVACFTEIDWYSRTLNISGSIYKQFRKEWKDVVMPAFSAGLDFAFEVLNMHRVGAEVLETHAAAQKLELDHLGFVIEGRRRKAVYKAGRYYDSIQLGLLREEWEQHPRVQAYEHGCCNSNFDHVQAEKFVERFNQVYQSAQAAQ